MQLPYWLKSKKKFAAEALERAEAKRDLAAREAIAFQGWIQTGIMIVFLLAAVAVLVRREGGGAN